MRTQNEIAAEVSRNIARRRRMDHEYAVLLPCLDFEHARPFLRPEATADAWLSAELTLTEDAIADDARRCIEGAWSTIEHHDQVQADRLVANCRAYVWLLGDDAQVAEFDAVPAAPFGGPKFAWLTTRFNWPVPLTIGSVRMADGDPCTPLCVAGCRS